MTDNTNPPINNESNNSQQAPLHHHDGEDMTERIERLGGEVAPDISPEEFTRLQETGSLRIDSQGRVRINRHDDNDPGISFRKRRAWYC